MSAQFTKEDFICMSAAHALGGLLANYSLDEAVIKAETAALKLAFRFEQAGIVEPAEKKRKSAAAQMLQDMVAEYRAKQSSPEQPSAEGEQPPDEESPGVFERYAPDTTEATGEAPEVTTTEAEAEPPAV